MLTKERRHGTRAGRNSAQRIVRSSTKRVRLSRATSARAKARVATDTMERVTSLGVAVPDSRGVNHYLLAHPDMGPLLLSIAERAIKEFPERKMNLTLYRDPEISDRYLTLHLDKADNENAETLLNRLDAITDRFQDDLAGVSGWIVLSA